MWISFRGQVTKPLRGPHLRQVLVRRFRRCDCGRTFRHYPEGVSYRLKEKRKAGLLGQSKPLEVEAEKEVLTPT